MIYLLVTCNRFFYVHSLVIITNLRQLFVYLFFIYMSCWLVDRNNAILEFRIYVEPQIFCEITFLLCNCIGNNECPFNNQHIIQTELQMEFTVLNEFVIFFHLHLQTLSNLCVRIQPMHIYIPEKKTANLRILQKTF